MVEHYKPKANFTWNVLSILSKSECSEQELEPKSESTRLEGPDGLVEYQGSNKLKNKKAIIIRGE